MPFEVRKVYRSLNAHEMHTGPLGSLGIIPKRVQHAMQLDATQNMARAYPLLRYEVRITLTPYQAAGATEVRPEKGIVYEVEGEMFLPVTEQALELVETSPLIGREEDPQKTRQDAEQGTVETMRTNAGELVDVRSKPGSRTEPVVEPPSVHIEQPQSWPDGKAPAGESAEETEAIEAGRWQRTKPDEAVEKAIETRDPTKAPGRVSVIKSAAEGGGQDHGRGRR